jgi:hypothetical protein
MNGKEYFARSMTKVVEATHEAEPIACEIGDEMFLNERQ